MTTIELLRRTAYEQYRGISKTAGLMLAAATELDDKERECEKLRKVICDTFSHDPMFALEEGVDEIGHSMSLSDESRATIKAVLAAGGEGKP